MERRVTERVLPSDFPFRCERTKRTQRGRVRRENRAKRALVCVFSLLLAVRSETRLDLWMLENAAFLHHVCGNATPGYLGPAPELSTNRVGIRTAPEPILDRFYFRERRLRRGTASAS